LRLFIIFVIRHDLLDILLIIQESVERVVALAVLAPLAFRQNLYANDISINSPVLVLKILYVDVLVKPLHLYHSLGLNQPRYIEPSLEELALFDTQNHLLVI